MTWKYTLAEDEIEDLKAVCDPRKFKELLGIVEYIIDQATDEFSDWMEDEYSAPEDLDRAENRALEAERERDEVIEYLRLLNVPWPLTAADEVAIRTGQFRG